MVAKPHVLREYALLADGYRGVLVGPEGDFAWMCAPRWDSAAVFSSMMGGACSYAVTPRGRFVWGGYYEDGSLIWRPAGSPMTAASSSAGRRWRCPPTRTAPSCCAGSSP